MPSRLTETDIRACQPRQAKYTLGIGKGLTLLVMPDGSKYWRFRYRFGSKPRMLTVGRPYPETNLEQAVQRADELRAQVAEGMDPAVLRRTKKLASREVAAAAVRQAAVDFETRRQTLETAERHNMAHPAVYGGCRCGIVRYRLNLDALPPAYACHCTDCQTWTGSAFSEQAIVPEEFFEVDGSPACFMFQTPSGRESEQWGCARCFTRLYNRINTRPGKVIVRAGTLDRSAELMVAAHIWTRSRQPWLTLPSIVPSWPEAAPLTCLDEALAACVD